ncbi:IS110 family transposase [Pelagibacterium halotolerans]|uniref:IS110 family transposase n=1 Tax=Pelagibacterium halotolerans TaxID=531813 RepID=UPI00384CBF1F
MQGREMPEPNAIPPVYVGIDVCKDWLDVYLHPSGQSLRVSNDRVGHKRIKRVLSGQPVARVVMEATGKYHRAVQRSLHAAGLPVCLVNPLRARLFAEASGTLAKTDALDARMVARMGAALDPGVTAPCPIALEHLRELVGARTAATAEHTALVNRLSCTTTAFLRTELRRRIASCRTHICRLDAEIEARIAADEVLAHKRAILLSIPGIGPVVATALLTGMDELGTCSAKQAASLAGLAPLARDSGAAQAPRFIRGGRRHVRNALYMAALSASRHAPGLAIFAKRLKAAGKRPKVVLVAVMRKLIVLANTLIAQNRKWHPIAP